MSLTNFIAEVRRFDSRNPYAREVSNEQWEDAVLDAVQEYSSWEGKARNNLLATVPVNASENVILLPEDFLSAEDDALWLLILGDYRGKLKVPGEYPAQRSGLLSPFSSPLGATTDPPMMDYYTVYPEAKEGSEPPLSQDESGRYILILRHIITETRSHKLRYTGFHLIKEPGTNTVPITDRRLVKRLALGYAMEARARLAISKGNTSLATACQQLPDSYFAVRDEYTGAMGALG